MFLTLKNEKTLKKMRSKTLKNNIFFILGRNLIIRSFEIPHSIWKLHKDFKSVFVFKFRQKTKKFTPKWQKPLLEKRVYWLPIWYVFRKYLVYIASLNHQIIEYWVSRRRYWLVLSATGSEQGSTGCQHDELSENIWFAWSRSSNYWIFEEGKSDYGQTHTQTHRISSCRLDPFCRRGRVKKSIGFVPCSPFEVESELSWKTA